MPPAPPRSILLIDDDAISREVMQMTLEMHGYTVATAEDGAGALRFLEATNPLPETILMDTQMPGLSGLALIEALRVFTTSPGVFHPRIIAISASDPGEALRTAADGFLLKPISMESLAALLSEPMSATKIPSTAPKTGIGAEQGTTPLIDPVVLGKLKAMMPAASLREIYAATAADLKTRLASLQSAVEASNAPEVARIAHSIKGGCAMVGLTAARDAAARMEISNLPVTWPADLAQLHFALEGLEGMLADDFPA